MPDVRRYLSLARWLGPWADAGTSPSGVTREEIAIGPRAPGDRTLRAFLYRPSRRRAGGAWLVTPGLHFLGPDDPRLDRFARILCAAGNVVLCPFLPDYLALTVVRPVVDDLDRAFDALRAAHPDATPSIFSISFGSFPACGVAGRRGAAVKALVLFGGFASFRDVVRFASSKTADPLGQAVACLNLLPWIPGAPRDTSAIAAALRRFARETWNVPEMKEGRWREVAARVAAELPPEEAALCRVLAGLEPGAAALVEAVASRTDLPSVDPEGAGITCPVHVFHGVNDDVIPVSQAAILGARIPGARVRLTGIYGHSGAAAPSAMLREWMTMAAMLQALASV